MQRLFFNVYIQKVFLCKNKGFPKLGKAFNNHSYSTVYGIRAMFLALLIAVVRAL